MEKVALVIDDNSYIRKNIRDILEESGFVVHEANNGFEGVKIFEKVRPSLVTMDINMPNINGLQATKKILQIDPNANILICSSMLFIPYYQKLAFEAGAKSILSKPFTKLELIKAVNSLLLKKEKNGHN